MAKDKKKKDKKDKPASGKKPGKGKAATTARRLKVLSENPLVADVIAAALVATAAALRDPQKARQLAAQTGDELGKVAKDGAERGTAMWQLAMEIGRRSLDALTETSQKPGRKAKATPKPKTPAPKKTVD